LSDIILVSEPEAAAIYTARYLRRLNGRDFLRPSECFIGKISALSLTFANWLVLDCGGGTVDVVTYLVKKVVPNLVLETVTIPTGEKCGSVFIDNAFKDWLRRILGDHHYRQLDPDSVGVMFGSYKSEGQGIRELMKAFIPRKERFRGTDSDVLLTLPEPLNNLTTNDRSVIEGQIRITAYVAWDRTETTINKFQGNK
jgi:hypothetical protein